MASEIEKLLTEQETTSTQVELFNENKETFEDLLLEQMITNEEVSNFTSTLANSISSLKDMLDNTDIQEVEVVNSNDFLPAPVESTAITPEVLPAEAPNFQTFFDERENVANEIAKITKLNEEIKASNAQADQEFASSFQGKLTEFSNKLPVIGDRIGESLATRFGPEATELEAIPDTPRELDFYNELEDIQEKVLFAMVASEQHLGELVKMQKEAGEVVGSASMLGDKDKPKEDDDGFSFDGLGGLFKGIGKKLGKFGMLAKGALKIGGSVLTAGFILADVFEGFTSDERIQEISGKAKEDLSEAESGAVALANVIEGLSFGLIDAKDTFPELVPIVDVLQDGIDQIFDPDIGLIGTLTSGFMNGVGQLLDGDIMGGLGTILDGFLDLPSRVIEVVGRWATELVEMLPTEIANNIKEKFGNMKEMASTLLDGASSFLGFGDDDDKEKEKLAEKEEDSGGGFFGSLFGGDDEEEQTASAQPSNSALGFSSNTQAAGSQGDTNQPMMLNPVSNGTGAQPISSLGSEGAQTMSMSKQRFDEQGSGGNGNGGDTTVVVNQQKSEGRSIQRSKQNSDWSLAFLNAGMADG